jgi:hypothetical protein
MDVPGAGCSSLVPENAAVLSHPAINASNALNVHPSYKNFSQAIPFLLRCLGIPASGIIWAGDIRRGIFRSR